MLEYGASSPESNKSIKGNKRRKVEEYTSSFAMLTNMVGLNVSLVIWFRIIRTYCVMIACLIAESLFSFRQIKAASDGYSQGISKAQLKTMGQTLAYKCTDQDYPAPATFRVIPLEQMRHLAASQNLLFNIQFRFFTRFLLTEKEKRKKVFNGTILSQLGLHRGLKNWENGKAKSRCCKITSKVSILPLNIV